MIMLALLVVCALNAQGERDEAQTQLARAEAHDRAGRYSDARSLYERIAKTWPDTPAGKTAQRRAQPSAFLGWDYVVEQGPSANRVDVVLMGDGYELPHLKAFVNLAADIPPLFERQPTFREYWSYFNFIRCDLVSAENGVDGFGRDYDTALNAKTLGTYAGHVGIDRERVRAMLAELPGHDSLAICFVKNGVLGTGGGGIAVIGGLSATTTVHEWGHAFGGLGDEYDTEQSAHQGAPGRAPNVSDTADPKLVPWAHWIEAKHPGVGVYEGAAARVHGAWRPTTTGCTMASGERFCVVCQEALVLRIYSLVDPIDSCKPEPQPDRVREPYKVGADGLELSVKVLRPATHQLEVSWWIEAERRAPVSGEGTTGRETRGASAARSAPSKDRTRRGPLEPILEKPFRVDRVDDDALHVLRITTNDLQPGRYHVVCRAKDRTMLPGQKWPWVLKDERGLLESERAWWIEIPPR